MAYIYSYIYQTYVPLDEDSKLDEELDYERLEVDFRIRHTEPPTQLGGLGRRSNIRPMCNEDWFRERQLGAYSQTPLRRYWWHVLRPDSGGLYPMLFPQALLPYCSWLGQLLRESPGKHKAQAVIQVFSTVCFLNLYADEPSAQLWISSIQLWLEAEQRLYDSAEATLIKVASAEVFKNAFSYITSKHPILLELESIAEAEEKQSKVLQLRPR